MKVAAIQMASGPIVEGNLREAARLIARAADDGAKLVVLPENFALMALHDGDRLNAAEPDEGGPIQTFLSTQARVNRIWLVGGTIPMKARQPMKTRAACLLFNDRGEPVARYDKIHLFDVQLDNGEKYQESASIEPGDDVVVVDTPIGRVGLAVCYDLRFPELFRALLDKGAEIFTLPSAFTAHTGRAHWEPLVRARAIENLAYVIAAAQGGYHVSGRETHGDAMIVSPWGDVLDRLGRGSGVVIADCDRAVLNAVRGNLPSIHHRRLRA
jgi:deaminated glutathione amidase